MSFKCLWFWADSREGDLAWLTLLSHIQAIMRLKDHLCLGWDKKTENQMKLAIALLTPLTLAVLVMPVKANDCSTAFVCSVVNHQRMSSDGTLTKIQSEPFGFRLEKNILIPQKDGSPLGDGTLEFELKGSVWTEVCKLRRNPYSKNYQFEGDNGLYAFEYINGQMLISNHKHHDFFEVVAAKCREL